MLCIARYINWPPTLAEVIASGAWPLDDSWQAGIAAFLGALSNAAEQLTPTQRWYRILSHALRHFLRGRVLKPPERLVPAAA
jgi:hypothetical protein